MYRQRKRDLNLKPNRQLDKRSSRGMIYENEELRMRTIAICEDVDRGQSDIKKLRKENDHLKREIWGLRDEYEKLEEMLKKVCISANIPEFQLDIFGQRKKGDSTEDSDNDDDDDISSYGGAERHLKTGVGGRQRRESGASVVTFDSEVESCMSSMFGDDPASGAVEGEDGGQETGFAAEDPGSVIINPESPNSKSNLFTVDVMCHNSNSSPEPGPSTSFAHQPQQWSHHTCISPPDLECVKEETESAVNSPISTLPPQLHTTIMDEIMLPNPSLIMFPSQEQQETSLSAIPGRKTPLIHITPASSQASNENNVRTAPQTPNSSTENSSSDASVDQDSVHSIGCITVVPKTFKVTSEIVVGDGSGESSSGEQASSKIEELPPKTVKLTPKKQDSDPFPVDIHNPFNNVSDLNHPQQRQSCYFPSAAMASGVTSNIHHRSFGMLPGFASCCCTIDDHHLPGGYQSEPSLNNPFMSPNTEDLFTLPNSFPCCRITSSGAANPVLAPLTLRSIWNTVDRNIVIGFYGMCGNAAGGEASNEPTVQEIIDELEVQFDNTLSSLQGIRLIPGRIFLSLKTASLVKSFVAHFEHDLVFKRKTTQQRVRIHFIEGTTQKTTSTLILSGIPPELNDLTVISSLNQFGQVVAPLEKRNYKGVDISERIAKMHLVVEEGSLPNNMVVNGYNIRIKVEKHQDPGSPDLQEIQIPVTKAGVVPQPNTLATTSAAMTKVPPTATTVAPAISHLKPHKPVTRSSSSAPRLETPPAGAVTCMLPTIEQKRQSSICVGNIPLDQHPVKLSDKHQTLAAQHKVTIAEQAPSNHPLPDKTQTASTSILQPPPKKPLARLLVSSPGSFNASPPINSPVAAGDNAANVTTGGGLRAFYRNFDPRRPSSGQTGAGETSIHAQLSPSSSYSPRFRRKSSVQFLRKGGGEPLPWCGCWGWGCGNS